MYSVLSFSIFPDAFHSAKMLCDQYYLHSPDLVLQEINSKFKQIKLNVSTKKWSLCFFGEPCKYSECVHILFSLDRTWQASIYSFVAHIMSPADCIRQYWHTSSPKKCWTRTEHNNCYCWKDIPEWIIN